MSSQVEFLKNLIESATPDNEAAVKLLRQICEEAAKKAPFHDLITMARCLYHIGIEASRAEASRN